MFGQPLPALFNAIGIGGQFDSDEPHDEGYQFLPRYTPDIMMVTSTNDPVLGAAIKAYPNPAKDRFIIDSEVQLEKIIVSNMFGQSLLTLDQPDLQATLDVSQFAAGVYIVTVVDKDSTWTIEFVKQ